MEGERKSRQRARAKGWKRSRDRDEGKRRGKGGRHGRIKTRMGGGDKRIKLTDSGFSSDDDGFNEATVNSHSLSLQSTDAHTKIHTISNQRGN